MDALIDSGAQVSVVSQELADALVLVTDDFVLIKGATSTESVKAKSCPDINFKIGNRIFKWHALVAPIDDKLILGLDFLLKFNVDILVSHGVISIGNDYGNLDASSVDYSTGDTFEISKVVVSDSIVVKPWSGKYVKILVNSKCGDWKIFESKCFHTQHCF